jgi:hypothetical protein
MESYNEKRYKRIRQDGYEFAAGALLKGNETPKSLADEMTAYDPFDRGMKEAIEDVVKKGLCKDDRI